MFQGIYGDFSHVPPSTKRGAYSCFQTGRWNFRVVLLACLLSVSPWVAWANKPSLYSTLSDSLEWLKLDTSLRGAYWSSDRRLTNYANLGASSFWLRAQPELGQGLTAKFEGWINDQGVFSGVGANLELREAFLSYRKDRFALSLGRQIAVWGRADRINPTDNISSRDLTLLFPDDDDQRRGNFMVSGNYAATDRSNLSFYWLPEFRPNVLPIGPTPGVIDLGQDTPTNLSQFAAKYDYSGGKVDWSFSYFDGIDRNPDLAIASVSARNVSFIRRYHRIRIIGMDAATNIGRYGLRGEVAYAMTQDETGNNPEIKNSYLFAVIGGDRSFFQYLNINLQYLFHYTQSFKTPDSIKHPVFKSIDIANNLLSYQTQQILQGISLGVNYQWLNESLETGINGVVFFGAGDFVLRPKITYKVTDNLRLTLGGDYYSGSRSTVLGRLKDNNSAYFEIRYGF